MDRSEIIGEINRLENSETTYQNCSKLAMLYVIIEHMGSDQRKAEYSSNSEFAELFNRIPYMDAMRAVEEYIDATQILHPKEYSAFIGRLRDISALSING